MTNQLMARIEELSVTEKALEWTNNKHNVEISHTLDYDPSGWQVHRVNGDRNDREWTLIGFGPTVLDALIEARKNYA